MRGDNARAARLRCGMSWNFRPFATGLAILYLCGSAGGGAATLSPEQLAAATVTDDISIPTPGELMAALNKQGKLDWAAKYRAPIATNYTSRAQMALNLGGLIADGYIAVEAEDAQQVKNLGKDILDLAKGLGVPKEIRDRGKSLTEKGEEKQWDVLREELEATQNEVKLSMENNKDQALVDLVTVGGWIRGTQVVSAVIAEHYTEGGASLLRQPAIVAFLRARLEKLPDKLRSDKTVKITRLKLVEIEQLVAFPAGKTVGAEDVKKLSALAAELVGAISRKELK